jgi:lipoate-protein ligase A
VVAQGRKLVGSAMRRQGGSILESWDGSLQGGCLGLPDDFELRRAVVTLTDLLGSLPRREVLPEAIVGGFAETFGATFARSELTAEERARTSLLARKRYGHARFAVNRDRALPDAGG